MRGCAVIGVKDQSIGHSLCGVQMRGCAVIGVKDRLIGQSVCGVVIRGCVVIGVIDQSIGQSVWSTDSWVCSNWCDKPIDRAISRAIRC